MFKQQLGRQNKVKNGVSQTLQKRKYKICRENLSTVNY